MAKAKQTGVALLTILLVVAMASILAAAMLKAQQSLLQRSASVFSQDQATLYALGAESLAKVVLQEDLDHDRRQSTAQDSLDEAWAKRVPPFPVEGGSVQAYIDDMQGRFNVNNLWQEGQVNMDALAVYLRLLQQLGLPANLSSPLIDWLDPDNLPYDSEGAEEDWYLRLKPAYRAANQPIVDISELSLLRGYTPEVLAKLRPYVCALPVATTINVNTASPVVISALSDNLSVNSAKQLVDSRPKSGYGSVDAFLQQPVFASMTSEARQKLSKVLGVSSNFFRVYASAEIDGRQRIMAITLQRSEQIRTLSRDWSQPWQVAQNITTTDTAVVK